MRALLCYLVIASGVVSSPAQDLDRILEDHFRAAAQDKMENIETIVTSGKNLYKMAGIESSFTRYQARPNKIRVQSEYQGSGVIQTYNGTTGWMVAPSMGIPEPVEMKGNELEAFLNQGEFENPLWNYKEKGNRLELLNTNKEGAADQLKMTTRTGDELYFLIDRKSHLITSITSIKIMGGSEKEIKIELSDYKSIRGIPFAQQVVTKIDGEVVTTILIEKVAFNSRIDAALFEKPEIK